MDAAVSSLKLVVKHLSARELCELGLTCRKLHSIVAAEHQAICRDFSRGREVVPVKVIWYYPFA